MGEKADRNMEIVALSETMTEQAIGDKFGISRQRVHQILKSKGVQKSPCRGAPKTYDYDVVSAFIDKFWRENYRPPSIRDIQDGVGISSSSTANRIMHRISEGRGDTIALGSARGIVPLWVRQAIDKATPNGI